MYQYYLKIVPTRYRKINGQSINTNQYSVSTHKKAVTQNLGDTGLPGVFFMFEISPILVQMKESRRWVQPAAQDHRGPIGLSLYCGPLFCADHRVCFSGFANTMALPTPNRVLPNHADPSHTFLQASAQSSGGSLLVIRCCCCAPSGGWCLSSLSVQDTPLTRNCSSCACSPFAVAGMIDSMIFSFQQWQKTRLGKQ